MKPTLKVSIRCYFPGMGNHCTHTQEMKLTDIPKWIEAYRFTHPTCEAVTVKVWLLDDEWRAKK